VNPPSQMGGNHGSGLESHPEVAEISQRLDSVARIMEWLDANPEGGQYADEQGRIIAELTPDQARRALRTGERELARLETQKASRVEHLRHEEAQTRSKAMTDAQAAYPWLGKPESDERAIAAQVLSSAPYIQQHPEWPMWLADAVAGRQARLARASGAKTGAQRPVPPRVPPPGGAAPSKVDPLVASLAEAEVAFEKSGRQSDYKRMESIRRQLSRRT
jgi:hypothetical protein